MNKLSLACVFMLGCYSSSGSTHDARPDTGPVDTFEIAEAVDVIHDPVPDGVECTSSDQCVVALPQDRCCTPDPVAVTRHAAEADPCLHVLGEAWEDRDGCISVLCERCMEFSHRAYAADCVDGHCVLVEDFCEPMEIPDPVAVLDASITPRGGWEQYRGRVVTVYGSAMLGPDSCECCFECDCMCVNHTVQQTLECNITLRGSLCNEPWECTGTECEPACSPQLYTHPVSATGYLVDTEETGLELWVMDLDDDDCPPPGPNPEGAPCTPFSDEDECEEGLFCFYWGDVLMPCWGECRPYGTACVLDTDCDEGEVCYNGYCMWCCPG